MVMDGHRPVVDLQARHLDRGPHLDPAHPARLPWQEPVSVAYDAAASDFDCRRAERLKLRPDGEDELLTLTAATAQQPPAGVGQFQPVCVQAGSPLTPRRRNIVTATRPSRSAARATWRTRRLNRATSDGGAPSSRRMLSSSAAYATARHYRGAPRPAKSCSIPVSLDRRRSLVSGCRV